jgi:UDP-N-acetylmuramyl pentapeptide phosphotransferase/UDP-N-acetylglucosamine-1-phosphate transferase
MIQISDEILLLTAVVTSFVITYVSIPSIIKVARSKNLYDVPDERSSHNLSVPTLGGLAIFAGFTISALMFSKIEHIPELKYIIVAVIIMFFIGLKDDILIIAPLTKLGGQIVAALIIILMTDLRFTSFHGFFGIFEIPVYISIPFTLFVFLIVINGFNLIDGIDGLSSSVGIIASITLGIWFYFVSEIDYSVISAGLTGGLIAFIRFNVFSKNEKIFMGDTGSLILGLIVTVLVIKFNEMNKFPDFEFSKRAAPAISFAILILPLFDTVRIIFIRFFQRKPIFKPDKQHIHHLLIEIGLTHRKALLLLIIVNILFAASGFILQEYVGIRRLILLYFLLAMIVFYIPSVILKKRLNKKNI